MVSQRACCSVLSSEQRMQRPIMMLLGIPGRTIVFEQDEQLFEYRRGIETIVGLRVLRTYIQIRGNFKAQHVN